MKTLTIHNPAQPAPGDYCHAIDGELAMATPLVCDRADCRCDSTLVGLNSMMESTTVIVSDTDLTMADLVAACEGFLHNTGWAKCLTENEPAELHEVAHDYMGFVAAVAEAFDVGEVLRPRYNRDVDLWEFICIDATGGAK